jgi:hypothetical protein
MKNTVTQSLDLKTFEFPAIDAARLAFSTFDTIPELLAEAKLRGMENWDHPYSRLFANLFFNGGKVKFKKDVDEDFRKRAWAYCRVLMRSFAPKHEHKTAVCALIMSEILELEK